MIDLKWSHYHHLVTVTIFLSVKDLSDTLVLSLLVPVRVAIETNSGATVPSTNGLHGKQQWEVGVEKLVSGCVCELTRVS